MAMLKASGVQHQISQHRGCTPPLFPLPLVDRTHAPTLGWRSSCSQAARLPTWRTSCKSRAVAPPYAPSLDANCEDVMKRLRDTENLRNCLGLPLSEDEQKSLVHCLDNASLGVDSCLVEGLPSLRSHLLAYIGAVAHTQSDDLELVEGAMLLIEQLSLVLGTSSAFLPGAQGRFAGQWQMLVTTGGGWPYGRLQYVPVIELLDLSEDGQHFRLETQAGPLSVLASGGVTWLKEPNHLHYHVTDFRVELLGGALSLPAPVPDDDLFVFAGSQESGVALARSSLGGITLMERPV